MATKSGLSNTLFIFLISFLIFQPGQKAFSLPPLGERTVVINEIAWMGTEVSHSDEWIELYNNTEQIINLDGWLLKAEDGTPKINLKGDISGGDFFILERSDDETLPGILADQIYTGASENGGENLKLFDNLGNLIDEVNCAAGWFAGENSTKQTMERKNPKLSGSDPTNWQTSLNSGGTPKTKNSILKENQSDEKNQVESKTESVQIPESEKRNQKFSEKELATISEQVSQISREANFSPLIVASLIAISAGVIILILKKFLLKKSGES